jgi:hypothetical protein
LEYLAELSHDLGLSVTFTSPFPFSVINSVLTIIAHVFIKKKQKQTLYQSDIHVYASVAATQLKFY